jgi:predicted porin
MIKKNLLTASVIALAVSTSAAFAADEKASPINNFDVKVFGEVRTFVEATSRDDVDISASASDTKFGFKASGDAGLVKIFGELSADVDVNADGDNDLRTRYAYVGVGLPKLGNVSIGRQVSLQEGFVDKADVFYSAGNNSVQKQAVKQNNSVVYSNSFGSVKVGAMAVMTDDAQNETVDMYQIGAEVMGIGVAMGVDNLTEDKWYGIGASRDFGKIGVAASLSAKDPNVGDRVIGLETAVSYSLNDLVTATGGYNKTDVSSDDGHAIGQVAYKVSSNLTAFANVDYDITGSDYTGRAGMSLAF